MTEAPERPNTDPELAILAEIESELLRELGFDTVRPARRSAPTDARLRNRRFAIGPARVTRRALLLVVLVCLVGTTALAGRSVLGGGSRSGRPTERLLASGGAGRARWQLQGYVYQGRNCYALFAAGSVASACTRTPRADSLSAVSALAGPTRLTAGLTGAGVTDVQVRVGVAATAVATRPVPAGDGAQLQRGERWFLAALPDPSGALRAAPAWLTRRDARGRVLGRPLIDCSLGAASAACRAAAAHLAGGYSG